MLKIIILFAINVICEKSQLYRSTHPPPPTDQQFQLRNTARERPLKSCSSSPLGPGKFISRWGRIAKRNDSATITIPSSASCGPWHPHRTWKYIQIEFYRTETHFLTIAQDMRFHNSTTKFRCPYPVLSC